MTPHIEAKLGDIAKDVIMPGDPNRAKMIADTFLEQAKLVTSVRGILGYTGFYKGKEITVMASGMGCPSMGIYSYELFHFYDVERIIRIGSVGSFTKNLNLYDLVLVESSYSDSNYAYIQSGEQKNQLCPSSHLNQKIEMTSKKLHQNITKGTIYCTDVFYCDVDYQKMYQESQILGVEMESFALFQNARALKKEAACILTVSNNFETKEETTSLERQNSFKDMVLLALESCL